MPNKSTRPLSQIDVITKIQSHLSVDDYNFSETRYVNNRTKMQVRCIKHGLFERLPIYLMNGAGCPICEKHKNPKGRLTVEQYKVFASEIYDNKYDYSLVTDISGIITIVCPEHDKFTTRASAHISPKQKYSCRYCHQKHSKGEIEIKKFLDLHNIEYIMEYSIKGQTGIRNNFPLRYDFFLPTKKTVIEFDGRHHFVPTKYGGQNDDDALAQHKLTKLYDGMKTLNAILLGYRVIRIGVAQYQNIDRILIDTILADTEEQLGVYY